MKTTTYRLENLCCPTEEQLVRRRLQPMAGIELLTFDLLERRLTVKHTLDDSVVLHVLESLGVGPRPLEKDGGPPEESPPPPPWKTLGLAGSFALASEFLTIAGWTENSPAVIGLAVAAIGLGGRETLRKGWLALRSLTLNMNFLMAVAILGALAIGEWPEAATVTVLFGVAEALEALAMERARHAIRQLLELAPESAWLVDTQGQVREVLVGEVEIGQRVRVRPGERIPLDGVLISGRSAVDQAPITGESIPVEKSPGDKVFAGTINGRGTFDLEINASRGQTTLDRIIAEVQQAQADRAPTQRFIDRFAAYYTPLMLGLALLTAALPPLVWGQEPFEWIYRALVLLVIACPCALVIATPVSVVSGLTAAARLGILVRGGSYLELGRHLTLLALDKTGTITRGRPEVTDVVSWGDLEPAEVLRRAAALEGPSEHPVAAAVLARYGQTPPALEEFDSLTGRGVRGRLEGCEYYLGNHRLVEERGVCSRELEARLDELEEQGKTAVVLMDDTRALGIIAVADTIREGAAEALTELHQLGLKVMLLTGDNQRTAESIARQVGIDVVQAEMLPQDKLAMVEREQRNGHKVGMVGDGINDAPALARADLGFAMGAAGTDTAIETADVALMHDDLRKLPEFFRLSRSLGRVLAQNIVFSLVTKLVFFGLAVTGHATLWMAVFADLGASLLVVFNGMRLLRPA